MFFSSIQRKLSLFSLLILSSVVLDVQSETLIQLSSKQQTTNSTQTILQGKVILKLSDKEGDFQTEEADILGEGPNIKLQTPNWTIEAPYFQIKGKSLTAYQKSQKAYGENLSLNTKEGMRFSSAFFETKKQKSIFKKIQLTYCPVPNSSWWLSASSLEANQKSNQAFLWNTTLWIHGVPVFYLPYYASVLEDKRTSGFLSPLVSTYSSQHSFYFPYYFNLAPEYDDTLALGVLSKGGGYFENSFRYLGEEHSFTLNAAYGKQGAFQKDDFESKEGNFSYINANEHYESFIPLGTLTFDAKGTFFHEDSSVHPRVYLHYLDYHQWPQGMFSQYLKASFRQDAFLNASIESRYFSLVGNSTRGEQRIYALAPRVQLNWSVAPFGLLNHFRFQKDQFIPIYNTAKQVERSLLDWSLEHSLLDNLLKIKLKGILKESQQSFKKTSYFSQKSSIPSSEVTKKSDFQSQGGYQILLQPLFTKNNQESIFKLKPKLAYTYFSYQNQDELPFIDSTLAPLDEHSLFAFNRFVGYDRLSDESKVSWELGGDFFQRGVYFDAGIGGSYSLQKRKTLLPNVSSWSLFDRNLQKNKRGPIMVHFSLSEGRSTFYYSHGKLRRFYQFSRFFYQYDNDEHSLFQLDYHLLHRLSYPDDIQEIRLMGIQRISRNWVLYGRKMNDLKNHYTNFELMGLMYENCCMQSGLAFLKTHNDTNPEKPDYALRIVFTLKGLHNLKTLKDSFPDDFLGMDKNRF